MKVKNKPHELQRLIVTLLQRIAQINTLPRESRKIHDFVAFKHKKLGYVAYSIVSEVESDQGSWILSDRDEPLWNEVVAKLCDLNRDVVSLAKVEERLRDFVWKYKLKEWSLSGISRDAQALINTIKKEKGRTTRVFLPIWGLIIRVSPFLIGDVEFRPRAEYVEIDKLLEREEPAEKGFPMYKIPTIAATESHGDDRMVIQNAEAKVNKALNIFRALTHSIIPHTSFREIGIMGTFYPHEKKLYFIKSNQVGIDALPPILGGGQLYGILDRPVDQYLTEVFLPRMGFQLLSNLLVSHPSKFDKKLLRGAEWLGEATKPDTLEAKFLKVAFAVDAIVGEASEDIPDKGKRARIAERSAFLLAERRSERKRVYDNMRKFIEKRDELAHGSELHVSQWETEKFGVYARSILTKLLLREPPFKTMQELVKWVQRKSFRG